MFTSCSDSSSCSGGVFFAEVLMKFIDKGVDNCFKACGCFVVVLCNSVRAVCEDMMNQ